MKSKSLLFCVLFISCFFITSITMAVSIDFDLEINLDEADIAEVDLGVNGTYSLFTFEVATSALDEITMDIGDSITLDITFADGQGITFLPNESAGVGGDEVINMGVHIAGPGETFGDADGTIEFTGVDGDLITNPIIDTVWSSSLVYPDFTDQNEGYTHYSGNLTDSGFTFYDLHWVWTFNGPGSYPDGVSQITTDEIFYMSMIGGAFEVVDGQIPPVPEPATILLLGTGLVGLASLGRKRFLKK